MKRAAAAAVLLAALAGGAIFLRSRRVEPRFDMAAKLASIAQGEGAWDNQWDHAKEKIAELAAGLETERDPVKRFNLRRDFSLEEPEFVTGGPLSPKTNTAPYYATMGIAPDLMEATKKAVRSALSYLEREHGLTREEAYALASVAVDLKVSEVVDAPNWVVSAFVPLSIFGH